MSTRLAGRRVARAFGVQLPVTGRYLQERFRSLGDVRGLLLADIVAATAAPDSWFALSNGHAVYHWQSAPGWGAIYARTMLFDHEGRCVAVRREYPV